MNNLMMSGGGVETENSLKHLFSPINEKHMLVSRKAKK